MSHSHEGEILRASWSPHDENVFASASDDGCLNVWDLSRKKGTNSSDEEATTTANDNDKPNTDGATAGAENDSGEGDDGNTNKPKKSRFGEAPPDELLSRTRGTGTLSRIFSGTSRSVDGSELGIGRKYRVHVPILAHIRSHHASERGSHAGTGETFCVYMRASGETGGKRRRHGGYRRRHFRRPATTRIRKRKTL